MGAQDKREGSTVLVVSTDPVIAGLLGLLVELERHRPAYAEGGESPQAALTRHRPHLVLVDIEHRDGFSDAFLTHAAREGAQVVAFGHRQSPDELREQAEARALPWLELPTDRATFGQTLAEALHAT